MTVQPTEIIPTVELPDLAPLVARTLVKQAEDERLKRRREEEARVAEIEARRKAVDAALRKIVNVVAEAESLPIEIVIESGQAYGSMLRADLEAVLAAKRWPAVVQNKPDSATSIGTFVTIHMPRQP